MSAAGPAAVHVVVMGVSGSGKSVVASAVAEVVGAAFIEGDDLHPPGNVAKMAAGRPLTDTDREPWLDRIAARIADAHARGRSTVTACSALRRAYRDRLRAAVPPDRMRFILLDVDEATVRDRMAHREHFMPSSLLASQFAILESLEADEPGAVIDGRRPRIDVVVAAVSRSR